MSRDIRTIYLDSNILIHIVTEDQRVKLPSKLSILRLAEFPEFFQSIREES